MNVVPNTKTPSNVLSQVVSTPGPTSKPRKRKIVWVEDTASLCDQSSSSDDDVPSPPPSLPTPVCVRTSSIGKATDQPTVEPSAADRDKFRADIATEALILEQKFLTQHRDRDDPSDYKHWYQMVSTGAPSPWTASGIELYAPLCIPALGDAVNQRIGNSITLLHTRIKVCFYSNTTAASLQSILWPKITMLVIRDKLPITPGLLPSLWANGTNPPSSQTALFDRLGLISTPTSDRCAVINPTAYNRYHIHHLSTTDTQTWGKGGPIQHNDDPVNPTHGFNLFRFHEETIDIPLHEFNMVTPGFGNVNAVQNGLYFLMRNDYGGPANEANNGFFIGYTWSSDTTFKDNLQN